MQDETESGEEAGIMKATEFANRCDEIISDIKAAKDDALESGLADGLAFAAIAADMLNTLVLQARDSLLKER